MNFHTHIKVEEVAVAAIDGPHGRGGGRGRGRGVASTSRSTLVCTHHTTTHHRGLDTQGSDTPRVNAPATCHGVQRRGDGCRPKDTAQTCDPDERRHQHGKCAPVTLGRQVQPNHGNRPRHPPTDHSVTTAPSLLPGPSEDAATRRLPTAKARTRRTFAADGTDQACHLDAVRRVHAVVITGGAVSEDVGAKSAAWR